MAYAPDAAKPPISPCSCGKAKDKKETRKYWGTEQVGIVLVGLIDLVKNCPS